jgi:DDE family transposase
LPSPPPTPACAANSIKTAYPAGIKVSDAELAAVNISRHDFRGDWNYTINPKALTLER